MNSLEFLQRVRTLVVVAMFSDDVLMRRLVLKGGNLMDLVYGISARSSLDVDFSIDGDFPDAANLANRVETALSTAFSEEGYVVFDVKFREVPPFVSDDLKDFWGGYKAEFKLISRRRFDDLPGDVARIRRNADPRRLPPRSTPACSPGRRSPIRDGRRVLVYGPWPEFGRQELPRTTHCQPLRIESCAHELR